MLQNFLCWAGSEEPQIAVGLQIILHLWMFFSPVNNPVFRVLFQYSVCTKIAWSNFWKKKDIFQVYFIVTSVKSSHVCEGCLHELCCNIQILQRNYHHSLLVLAGLFIVQQEKMEDRLNTAIYLTTAHSTLACSVSTQKIWAVSATVSS